MANLETLKEKILQVLPDVEFVIGWQRGYDPLHAAPLFIRKPEDLEKLIWDETCVHNLASYLAGYRGRTIGLLVKGCDSRSVVQLLQERLLERNDVKVIGIPCTYMISVDKIRARMNVDTVTNLEVTDEEVIVSTDKEKHAFPKWEVAADKCLSCNYPNPLTFDHLAGEPVEHEPPKSDRFARLDAFESMSMEERFEFWRREMSRCVRCYACRNACPLCACKEHCIAESRLPHYQTAEADLIEKCFFQVIHSVHLAGRCTECGECERACPMDIPVLLFKKKMANLIQGLFDYEAGIDQTAVPPLLTFQVEETHIHEEG